MSDPSILHALQRLRTGNGVDVHPFVDGRPLVLGGVTVPFDRGLDGHSDADVIAHAVSDAVLGAAGGEDIGSLFPSSDPALQGADSMGLLASIVERVTSGGMVLISVDVIVVMQEPRLAPHRDAIKDNLAAVLALAPDRVTVRATTTDGLGFVGRGEGAAAIATCLAIAPAG